MDKDTELLKIQIYADYCHTIFTFRTSLQVSALVGLLLVVLGIAYQGLIPWFAFYLAIFLIAVFLALVIRKIFKDYHNDLNFIQILFSLVEKNDPIPTFKEMKVLREMSDLMQIKDKTQNNSRT